MDGPGGVDRHQAETVRVALPARAGSAAARNTGLSRATGRWVVPLDADDLLDESGLKTLAGRIQALPPSVTWIGASRIGLNGEPTPHTLLSERQWPRHSREKNWTVPFPFHPNVVTARTAHALTAGGWPGLDVNEDLLYVMSLGGLGDGITVPEPLIRHRSWAGQTTHQSYPERKLTAFNTTEKVMNARRAQAGLDPIQRPSNPQGRFGSAIAAPQASSGGVLTAEERSLDARARIAVISDIHGDLPLFRRLLREAGGDPSRAASPTDVIVVQVGDLTGTRPSQTDCVALADRLMRLNPSRYVQLWGNREAMAIFQRDTNHDVPAAATEILDRWWATGAAKIALAVRNESTRDTLISHAGLTLGFWRYGSSISVQ